jgi:hypothetical protein
VERVVPWRAYGLGGGLGRGLGDGLDLGVGVGLVLTPGPKSLVAAVRGATAVSSHDPEMISGVPPQTADVRGDVLRRGASIGLVGSCRPVAGRSSILKTNRSG